MATHHRTAAPFLLDPRQIRFPDASLALEEPNGLLAIGGDLAPARLLEAYRQGIFPWYSAGQPILWWSPDPRLVLFPERLKVSRSLRKTLNRQRYRVTFDADFAGVVRNCAAPRGQDAGTWLTAPMQAAYLRLHELGWAHSIESWLGDELAGGLYGVAIGRVFFGESMFSRHTDASKVAFAHAVRQLQVWGYELIDCQVYTAHLASLGAEEMPRAEFVQRLHRWCDGPGAWREA